MIRASPTSSTSSERTPNSTASTRTPSKKTSRTGSLGVAEDDEPFAVALQEAGGFECVEHFVGRGAFVLVRHPRPAQRDLVRELLHAGDVLDAHEVALRWAGMPNKNERAATNEVLDALEAAGFLQRDGERFVVLRDP